MLILQKRRCLYVRMTTSCEVVVVVVQLSVRIKLRSHNISRVHSPSFMPRVFFISVCSVSGFPSHSPCAKRERIRLTAKARGDAAGWGNALLFDHVNAVVLFEQGTHYITSQEMFIITSMYPATYLLISLSQRGKKKRTAQNNQ